MNTTRRSANGAAFFISRSKQMSKKLDSEGNWRPCKYFRWVESPDGKKWLVDVGIFADGQLYNPNKYPEDQMREAIAKHQQEIKAKAIATADRRRKRRIYEAGQRILAGGHYGPASSCYICGKALFDPPSEKRGIGPECWDHVLSWIEQHKQQQQQLAV
jgi:hypothetical protein